MRSGNFPSVALFLLAAIIPKLSATDSGCPVTKPPSPAFVPPAPYQMNADTVSFWSGARNFGPRYREMEHGAGFLPALMKAPAIAYFYGSRGMMDGKSNTRTLRWFSGA